MATLSNSILSSNVTCDRYDDFIDYINEATAMGDFKEPFRSGLGVASSAGNGYYIEFLITCPPQQNDRYVEAFTKLEQRFLNASP